MTLYTKLILADTYYHQERYSEAETIQLLAIEPLTSHLGELNGEVLDLRWDIAWTWLKQGKVDDSRKLALKVAALVLKSRGDEQHQQYVSMVQDLSRVWDVGPDGTAVAISGLGASREKHNWRSVQRTTSRSVNGLHHDLRTL